MNERFSSALREYLIAVGAVVLATAIDWVIFRQFGSRFPGYVLIFLFAIMAAAWRGYGPGVAASVFSLYVAPYAFRSDFKPSSVSSSNVIQTLILSLLVSAIAASQRRKSESLQRGKDELEARITARTAELERTNTALLETERRLHDVLDSVSESFLAIDREWRFTYVNRRILDSLGLPASEVIGRSIWELFPEARDTEYFPQYRRVMEERVPVHFEMFYAPTGHWVEVNAHPTPEGLSAYVEDITERKLAAESSARLASIVESSSDAIVSKDLEGIVRTWNSAAERLYGYSAAEIVGKSLQLVVGEDRHAEEQEILEKLRRGERLDHFETVRRRKDGTLIDVSLTVSPVRNPDGQITGASHIARDITAQKRFENQLRQMQKLESLGILAGGVAHDFNNLLVGIVGNASLALDDAAPQTRQYLQDIVNAGERAADLTRQLLAYAGKGKVHTRLIDMSDLVRDIAILVRTSIPRTVNLKMNLADGLPPVMADGGQMQQILMNLVINAAESIPESQSGSVTVVTGCVDADDRYLSETFGTERPDAGSYVTLEVQDTGCGMTEETRARIFDPFFTTKFLGRGLGLSAVLGIVRSHGGALRVYSEPGRGTTFKLLFPAEKGVAVTAPRPEATQDLKGAGHVLLVDDDDMVRQVARITLERHGYSVEEAPDGASAVQTLRRRDQTFHAVLLDLTMPVMGGEEALRHIASLAPGLKVILSSGFNESEAMRRFSGKGIAGFLQKPYTATQLARLVRDVVGTVAVGKNHVAN